MSDPNDKKDKKLERQDSLPFPPTASASIAGRTHYGLKLAAVVFSAVAAAAFPAHAQIASTPAPQGSMPGWSFAVTPYVWLPTLSADLRANGPRGGTANTSISAGIGDYISDINAGLMLGAEARHGRFSVLTDLIYVNTSLTSSVSHLSSVNLGSGPINIPRSQQLSTGTRAAMTIWSLAGGYTLLQGDWGNLDGIVGFRMLALNSTTNHLLSVNILAPDGTIALSRDGSLNIAKTYFNAIGGVTGRINIPNSKFYLPFYFDVGDGGLPLTWQAYGGIAYSAASWADLSVGYRYLTFQNGNNTGVRNLSLRGVIITANVRF
jgi:hypothetical protein